MGIVTAGSPLTGHVPVALGHSDCRARTPAHDVGDNGKRLAALEESRAERVTQIMEAALHACGCPRRCPCDLPARDRLRRVRIEDLRIFVVATDPPTFSVGNR